MIPCGVCGVNGSRPMGLVSFVGAVRRIVKCSTGGVFLPVRPNSICRACTSAAALRRRLGFGPGAPVRRKIGRAVS